MFFQDQVGIPSKLHFVQEFELAKGWSIAAFDLFHEFIGFSDFFKHILPSFEQPGTPFCFFFGSQPPPLNIKIFIIRMEIL